MINNTGSASVSHDSARELASRLEGDSSPAAQEMVQEALTLAETFRRWELQRPEDGPRVATIRRLFELNRRAMDYLASNHHPR
jgi:hypothetical protein